MAPSYATKKNEIESWLNNYFTELLPLFLSNDKKLNPVLHKQNKALLSSVFFVSNHLTLVDLVFYAAVHPLVSEWDEKERGIFINITRWFDHIQHLPELTALADPPLSQVFINTNFFGDQSKGGVNQAAAKGKGKVDSSPANEGSKTAAKEELSVAPTHQADSHHNNNGNKKDKLSQQKGGKEQQKKEQPVGKGKKELAPVLSATEDISRFDIRVGQIVSCKKHDAADSLYVEQIDVGEPEPRQVVSGLVKFIPLAEMQQRRVVILCNLKASNLKGVRSQAMVLCASNDDHTQVELVEPPEGATPGERVTLANFPGEPEKVLKKETLDKVLPDLKSNGDCVATYKGLPLMTAAGPCNVKSIANGGIR